MCKCENKCITPDCSCKVFISTDCVTLKEDLSCSAILKGQTTTEVLKKLDKFICDKFNSVTNFFDLINIGTGLGVYKGVSNLGKKELKSLLGSNLITLTQTANEIVITVNETALNTFIEANQKTYSALNIGTGAQVFKDTTTNGDNTQFNLRKINSSNSSINIVEGINDVSLSINQSSLPTYSVANSGTGTGIFTNNTVVGNNTQFNLKSIVSNTLTVSSNGTTLSIEQPVVSDIPRFIVNSAYTGIEETGSLSKPFKTIQGAINAFVGTGTALNPQFSGSEILIQKGSGYTFTGNWNYNKLIIILDEATTLFSTPSVGDWLCDLDTMADVSINVNVILNEGSILYLNKSGFKNSGTTVTTNNFAISKNISITGSGTILQTSTSVISNNFRIFESNFTTNNTFYNDFNTQFNLKGITVNTFTQSIYTVGGNSRIFMENVNLGIIGVSGLPVNTIFFNQIGGLIKINNSSIEALVNLEIILSVIFPLSKGASIPCDLILTNCKLRGKMVTLFQNISILQPSVRATSITTEFFVCTNIAKSPSILWTECIIKGNIFGTGSLDTVQVDITGGNVTSSSNHIGGNLVEVLVRYNSRVAAQSVLPPYSAFINTNGNPLPVNSASWTRDLTFPTI